MKLMKNTSQSFIGIQKTIGGPADFETAISATGLGKFNLLLLIISIPSGWATVLDTKTMAYVSPEAQCDLELSLENKGLLNAITYIGILSSGFIWGVLADTYGRKYLLVICYLLDTFFIILSGFSQNFTMLLISKYMAGFVMNGPTAILISLLSEFHCHKHRARFFLIQGMFSNLANVILPIMAWGTFQKHISLTIVPGLELHNWNVFILFCALPSLVSGFAHLLLPESPKFLMSAGRNEEALEVFRKLYSWNTGESPESYPIHSLIDERKHADPEVDENKNSDDFNDVENIKPIEKKKVKKEGFMDQLKNVSKLFCPPHVWIILFLTLVQMGYKMGLNSFKLWIPQMFTTMNDFYLTNGTNADFCDVMESMAETHKNISTHHSCMKNYDNSRVYTDLIIVQSASMLSFILTGSVINKLGNKNLFIIFGVLSGACASAIYFAKNAETVVALSTILTAVSAVNAVVFNVSVVELLPTRLRTIAISMTRLIGLVHTITGNIIFPHLLKAGCSPPFIFVGVTTICCSFLALFLPKENKLN